MMLKLDLPATFLTSIEQVSLHAKSVPCKVSFLGKAEIENVQKWPFFHILK